MADVNTARVVAWGRRRRKRKPIHCSYRRFTTSAQKERYRDLRSAAEAQPISPPARAPIRSQPVPAGCAARRAETLRQNGYTGKDNIPTSKPRAQIACRVVERSECAE